MLNLRHHEVKKFTLIEEQLYAEKINFTKFPYMINKNFKG